MSAQAGQPSATTDRQVLVVGGGLAGLATAAFLHRNGLSPVVVTAGEAAVGDVVLWSPAVSLLAELDLGTDLLASTEPVRRWHLHRGETTERLSSAHDGRWPFVATDRGRLRELLRTRLPTGGLRLSKTPRRLDPTDSGLRVEFDDGVSERFDVVVGADGVDSWVRRSRLDDGVRERGVMRWTLRADEELGTPGTVTELWGPDGTLTYGPLGSNRARLVTQAVGGSDLGPDSDPEAVVERLARSVDTADRPLDCGSLTELTVVGGRADRTVDSDRWAAGYTALVGSAARSLPSGLSVGPSLAVEDAYVLAAELTGEASTTAAMRRYAHRRRGRGRALDRLASTDALSGSDEGSEAVRADRARRAALLRSFFARRVPAVSADVEEHL
ncbi:FAD-dependent oxidoreductase [Salinigranum sp. GCM10025319]|uniref:FAD-dependent oxidoreductase n=1 Tax=Salinigranum sp. GCM10025319 TaxID=3252687 RepID=UPI00360B86A5